MKLILHRNFEKKFIKTPLKIREQFKRRRDLFLKDRFHPSLNNHPLAGRRKNEWSINVTGDWRAIYIWLDEETVIFLDLDTHSHLYGK
ncbi:MAG: type II toxin-antitoxin system RelE/ParE family toxin [Candidatus Paceibacterota bacterium]